MNTTPDHSPDPSEDKLAQLLAKAGPRSAPPAALQAEVRAAVHAEWRHLVQSRKQQQRRWLAAAAVLVAAVSVGWLTLRMETPAGAPQTPLIAAIAQGRPLVNGEPNHQDVRSGDVLITQADGARVELRNGVSIRIAGDTQTRWLNDSELQLQQGAIYVDSHDNAAALTIRTAQGDITHLGTRYLVDVAASQLRVAVREGRVAVHTGTQALNVDALQQLLLQGGAAQRSSLDMNDALWQWADALAQPFALENRSVAEFLQWVARETGCELSYASDDVERAAAQTLLHGAAIDGSPLHALQTVLAATDFRASLQGRQLVVVQTR